MQVGGEFLPRAQVGQVAPAFACEIDFPSEAVVFVEQHHTLPAAEDPGSPDGSHHPCRTAADNGYPSLHQLK